MHASVTKSFGEEIKKRTGIGCYSVVSNSVSFLFLSLFSLFPLGIYLYLYPQVSLNNGYAFFL